MTGLGLARLDPFGCACWMPFAGFGAGLFDLGLITGYFRRWALACFRPGPLFGRNFVLPEAVGYFRRDFNYLGPVT
jgi:hypothetical protein